MKDSHIQWTDDTFNPWEGCTKVSPGCANCYAENRNRRFGGGSSPNWGPGKPRRRTSESYWREPVRRNAEERAKLVELSDLMKDFPAVVRRRVFCASLADWLDPEVPVSWLADLLTLIFDCGFLDWQLLSKRLEEFRPRIAAAAGEILNRRDKTERNHAIARWLLDWHDGVRAPHNVWLGTSVEDQRRANERIPLLLGIKATVHFLSLEPLLERVSFEEDWLDNRLDPSRAKIEWAIVGGESGANARRLDVGWIESILAELRDAKVPAFVKQLGRNPVKDGVPMILSHAKGGDPAEWPERFRVQNFPEVSK